MTLFPKCNFKMILSLGVISCASISYAENTLLKVVGKAYDPESKALLYTETHTKISDVIHTVEYNEPDGTLFGTKTLDSSQSSIAPSFTQLNKRIGEQIEVTQTGNRLDISYQENSTAKVKADSIGLSSGMIVDAGFDVFVKQYWSVLQSGKSMDIKYVVPSKQDFFNFRFKRTPCLEGSPNEAVCFALSPISWVIKMAVDPIVVAYDPVDKSLLRFTGRANIADGKGDYKKVDIHYEYIKEH